MTTQSSSVVVFISDGSSPSVIVAKEEVNSGILVADHRADSLISSGSNKTIIQMEAIQMTTQTNAQVFTKGKVFTDIKKIDDRAVRFMISGKGECVVGFARDRNAFVQAFNGVIEEITKQTVIKRLAKYKGSDASRLVQVINQLKPVTTAAAQCTSCGANVSHTVKAYSTKTYNQVLCKTCQPGGRERSERTTVPTVSVKPKAQPKKYEWVTQTLCCDRCSGTGRISMFNHVEGGICFKCKGNKQVTTKVKVEVQAPAQAGAEPSHHMTPAALEALAVIMDNTLYECVCCHEIASDFEGDECDDCAYKNSIARISDEEAYAKMSINYGHCGGCGSIITKENTLCDSCDSAMDFTVLSYAEQTALGKVVFTEPHAQLPLWWNDKSTRYSTCHPSLPCDCGSTIHWCETVTAFACTECDVLVSNDEYTLRSHVLATQEDMAREAEQNVQAEAAASHAESEVKGKAKRSAAGRKRKTDKLKDKPVTE